MTPTQQTNDRQRAKEEAAEWVVRLSGSPGADDRAAFEAWRCASLDHEIAYARAASTWQRLDRLSALREPSLTPQEAIAALDGDDGPPAGVPAHGQGWRRWAAMAASFVVLVSVVSLAALFLGIAPAPAYATGIGERRVILLTDGSRVELNTNSRIVVHYARGHRTVDLEQGEALFRIARDSRPFEVKAGQVQLQSAPAQAGAQVNVRLLDQGARITVAQGQVTAQDLAEGARAIIRMLPAGSAATMAPAVFNLATLSSEAIGRSLAWRQGEIVLNGETLAEAAQDFNRYNQRQIMVADPRAGSLHMGGYFETSDLDGFVKAVGNTFPVHVSSNPAGDVVIATDAARAGAAAN